MSHIRLYQPADRDAIYDVCVRTADAGGDARGIFRDDRLWADVWAVPYVEKHPDLSWVVESDDGRVVGYLLASDDTDAFDEWFAREWWPSRSANYPLSGDPAHAREDRVITGAAQRGAPTAAYLAHYPAHLHIDLLPETQGQGLGRALMNTLFDELRRRGTSGVHLGIDPANTGAAAFYERLGFERLPAPQGAVVYGIRLTGGQ